ncbi:MAG: MmgE/PrpD family protein [Proteobacteria bacterium]|nr:MmgE/PrpD family protein [Pseudomonadota bacterium]MBU4471273.1 MmgE/PrpD family protein [Pseudomonadota bacterium]
MGDSRISRRSVLSLLGAGAALTTLLPISLTADSGKATPTGAPNRKKEAAKSGNLPQDAQWADPLGNYIHSSQKDGIAEDIRELARRHILDTLAAIVACRDLEASMLSRKFVLEHNQGSTAAPILGTRERCSLLDAILASGMTAHAAEINDFCPSAFVQPGASIIPTALCLGDARNLSGEAFLRSVITGYEIACRMPKALGPRNLFTAVLANHSVGPIFGSAAAAASLIRLPRDRMNHMFSYCVEQASGSWQWMRDVDHIEKAFVFGGMPARRGTECALFAEAGFTGIGDPFTGDPGWLNSTMFKGEKSDFNPGYLIEDLGKRFELPLVGYKQYPVGGPTQPAIELMLDMIKEVDRTRVRKVRIEMPGRTGTFAGAEMPALNLPYLCSIILADGNLDFMAAQSRNRLLEDKDIQSFMKNVEVIHDPEQEASPRVESARVILTLDDGSKKEKFLHHVKGFPEHPFDRNDVVQKAMELMVPVLGKDRSHELCNTVLKIEELKNVHKLVELIAGD